MGTSGEGHWEDAAEGPNRHLSEATQKGSESKGRVMGLIDERERERELLPWFSLYKRARDCPTHNNL